MLGGVTYWMPGNNSSLVKESLWHTPHACTMILTCLAPGSGVSLSTISKGPLCLDTYTESIYHMFFSLFMVFGISIAFTSGLKISNPLDVCRQICHRKASISLVVLEMNHLFLPQGLTLNLFLTLIATRCDFWLLQPLLLQK